jgi:hypothetical protein
MSNGRQDIRPAPALSAAGPEATSKRDAGQGAQCARTGGGELRALRLARSLTLRSTRRHGRLRLPVAAAHLLGARHRGSDGRQPKGLRLAEVLGNWPMVWEEQRKVWLLFGTLGGLN